MNFMASPLLTGMFLHARKKIPDESCEFHSRSFWKRRRQIPFSSPSGMGRGEGAAFRISSCGTPRPWRGLKEQWTFAAPLPEPVVIPGPRSPGAGAGAAGSGRGQEARSFSRLGMKSPAALQRLGHENSTSWKRE
ncbi:hypothetical protein HMPREF3038_03189 [Akkermansia sp. KLE1797]|nr:hypothetical protein HMPREF3038_03189 [Akkermansia sp. KLE1797]KXU52563.1 hypothetical protein HMPREF3039_03280 [Akkermansia sp. KLE1798]